MVNYYRYLICDTKKFSFMNRTSYHSLNTTHIYYIVMHLIIENTTSIRLRAYIKKQIILKFPFKWIFVLNVELLFIYHHQKSTSILMEKEICNTTNVGIVIINHVLRLSSYIFFCYSQTFFLLNRTNAGKKLFQVSVRSLRLSTFRFF